VKGLGADGQGDEIDALLLQHLKLVTSFDEKRLATASENYTVTILNASKDQE
jgi:hypothetical protein